MKTRTGQVVVGAAGNGTEILLEWEPGDKPDVSATVAMWFLDCPGQSPAWRHYNLTIIHLRPIPGVKPAHISRPGASHEVMLVALDPDKHPVAHDAATWGFLRPLNYVGQLHVRSDDEAKEVLDTLAHGVAHGTLWAEPPLSGQKEPWESQLRLLENHAAGKHFQ